MKSEHVMVVVLIPQCSLGGNGDGDNRSPKSKSSNDTFRNGWERTFAHTKNLNVN